MYMHIGVDLCLHSGVRVICNVSILLARRLEFYLTESKRLLANSGADLNANTKTYSLLYSINFQVLR
jgi:hypothetical protein